MTNETKALIGSRVRVKNIPAGDPDEDMNGRTGLLCRPFRDQRPVQDVGVRLDPNGIAKEGEYANINENEFEVIV